MRLINLYLLAILLFPGSAFAQKNKFQKFSSDANYKAGSVQLPDGTWHYGLIKDKNEIERYSRITFIDSTGQKTVFKPRDLTAYRLGNSQFKADPETNHFYQRVSWGKRLSIYKMRIKPTATEEYSVTNSGRLSQNISYEDLGVFKYFYKESEQVFQKIPQEGDFHTPLATFLKDCPELSKRILDKKLGKDDIEEIMNTYNFRCEY